MEEARLRSSGTIIDAYELNALSTSQRAAYRGELACPACDADAYFIREARNGRRACFGARPHYENCELASYLTEDGGASALDETDELINAGDAFQLEPNRRRSIRHVNHDSEAAQGTVGAVRYIRQGRGRLASRRWPLGGYFASSLRALSLRTARQCWCYPITPAVESVRSASTFGMWTRATWDGSEFIGVQCDFHPRKAMAAHG